MPTIQIWKSNMNQGVQTIMLCQACTSIISLLSDITVWYHSTMIIVAIFLQYAPFFGLLKSYIAHFHRCDWIMLNRSFILYSIFCNFSASNHLIILYNFALLNRCDWMFLSRSLWPTEEPFTKTIVFVVCARETIFLVHHCI